MPLETPEKRAERLDTHAEALAHVYAELSPRSDNYEEDVINWKKHILETDGDIDAHYGQNGAGKEEYLHFTRKYDIDKHREALGLRRARRFNQRKVK